MLGAILFQMSFIIFYEELSPLYYALLAFLQTTTAARERIARTTNATMPLSPGLPGSSDVVSSDVVSSDVV